MSTKPQHNKPAASRTSSSRDMTKHRTVEAYSAVWLIKKNCANSGKRELKRKSKSPAKQSPQLVNVVLQGIEIDNVEQLLEYTGFTHNQLAAFLNISESTFRRRINSGRFEVDESDRIVRLAKLFDLTVDLFNGDKNEAIEWLLSEKQALAGQTPFKYAMTETGAREVENLILRLEHGVFS